MSKQIKDLPAGLPAENGAGAAGSTAAALTPPRDETGAPATTPRLAAVSGRPGPQLVISGAKIEIGLLRLSKGVVSKPQTLACEVVLVDEEGEALPDCDLKAALLIAVGRVTERLEELRRGGS